MTHVLASFVKETTDGAAEGTATAFNLAGAASGFQGFVAAIGDGNTTDYSVTDGTDWEEWTGTITEGAPSDTLSRDTLRGSSNGGSPVDWGAGVKTITCTLSPARFATTLRSENDLSDLSNPPTARSNLGLGVSDDVVFRGIRSNNGLIRTRATGNRHMFFEREDGSEAALIWSDNPTDTLNARTKNASGATLSQGRVGSIPAGTRMLFQQTAAPTGWTKRTTHHNKALRVVSGTASSGGANAFTTVFGSGKSTANHVLSTSQIPAHSHAHPQTTSQYLGPHNGANNDAGGGTAGSFRTFDTQTGAIGGGGGHSHNLTMNLQFVDIIIAQKD